MSTLGTTTKKIVRDTPGIIRLLRLAFERITVPLTAVGSGVVSALKEFHQRRFRRRGSADVVVHQQELFHLRMIESCRWTNLALRETFLFGRGVGIKSHTLDL